MKHFCVAALLVIGLSAPAWAQTAAPPDTVLADKYLAAAFAMALPEWQARMQPDETIAVCNAWRNNPPDAEAQAILKRERARVELPKDGVVLGDWKAGFKIASDGHGGQFSDPPGTVSGGNCYACHQLDPAEVSYGTLGPSLKAYGRERGFDPEEARNAFIKIYDSQAVAACSNMPRFGANKVLNEQQIKDLTAYLFDPASPVNK